MDMASAEMIGSVCALPRRRGMARVRAWLIALAALVVVMVGVGGATRLTGSGLSITEWRPVTGAVPPLTDTAWAAEFAKYRDSPQYELLNRGMALGEFKFIYWWEWSHRQLGRLIGLVFLLPLLWFWARGLIPRRLGLALLGVGLLGALQGAVGWIMVASGLEPGMIAVAPIKLSVHLTIASLILASLVWLAAGLSERARDDRGGPARGLAGRRWAFALVGLILVQIALGGLVAGSRAGWTYNTWPLMDGRLVPSADALFRATPLMENFVDNPALVQFNHRLLAIVIVVMAVLHALGVRGAAPGSAAMRRASVVAGLCLAQLALGITTVVLVVPLWAGLGHQILAMMVLASAVIHARLSHEAPGGRLFRAGAAAS